MDILAKNLLILASAGSGKTFQLGHRVIGLVAKGVPPERIVALTFTRKAAGEFADSVLRKLAEAAGNPAAGERLQRELGLGRVSFPQVLEQVVRALPKFTLGTMDHFFARVVRGFQYELGLTGGKFDLMEGPRAEVLKDELLAEILGEDRAGGDGEAFFHAFRRAMIGREAVRVTSGLREFVQGWQGLYREGGARRWGPEELAGAAVEDWERHKRDLAAQVRRGLDRIEYTDKRQQAALEKAVLQLELHTIGSGSLGGAAGVLKSVLERAGEAGPLEVKFYQEFLIGGAAGDGLRSMVLLAARCELAAALQRTRAVREVVEVYDRLCEQRLRRRGLLGFDDVKRLMGEWVRGEEARLRREEVDFRLDARYDHWLLDEFQDTSRADWAGLLPLMDEAASSEDGSLFLVGDKKQAIYGWRGGEAELFDEVRERYAGRLAVEPMADSWRSCPEVLGLVNRVCGDRETMHALFGAASDLWEWQDHVAAAPLRRPERSGEARVELVEGGREEKKERMMALLRELGVGEREMTCGVLLRGNRQVREVADALREEGFDVIEEGQREPAKDNPVGIALWQLMRWLADPADEYARRVVEMSPVAAALRERADEPWFLIWERWLARASELGFAGMVEEVVERCGESWSAFGKRRAGDILDALMALDAQGEIAPRAAAQWLERLVVSQSPGAAAVQVMTIHKSKGLGFDVVVLPELPNDAVPSALHFEVAMGDDWITAAPPKWARTLLPELRGREDAWSVKQRYEALCTLYVALTRAKRGLYVLLEKPADSQDENKPSLANWLARAVGADGVPGVKYQDGSSAWVERVAPLPGRAAPERPARMALGPAIRKAGRAAAGTSAGRQGAAGNGGWFGREVHALLERIGWTDEEAPELPPSAAGRWVEELLRQDASRQWFRRDGRRIALYREQPVEAVIGGQWISGVIDRLLVHRDGQGRIRKLEVLDFKTDATDQPEQLLARYGEQLAAYRRALEPLAEGAPVECYLLSARTGAAALPR